MQKIPKPTHLKRHLLHPGLTLAIGSLVSANSFAAGTIEEVTVKARKVEESMQSVPVAISAISGKTLEQTYATDIGDLEGFAPNVTIGRHSAFPSAAQISIRGLSSMDIERTFDPSVGVSVDGVFMPTNTNHMLDMFDIDQVEILRGPQGTLFGKNTIGGVVNARRKQADPSEFYLDLETAAGNFGRMDAKVAVNQPISDSMATRLSLFSQKSDGFIDNAQDQDPNRNGEELLSARLANTFLVSENLEFVVNIDYLKDQSDSGAVLNITNPDSGYIFSSINPSIQPATDFDNVSNNAPNVNDVSRDNFSLEANYEWNELTLTSVTGYAHQDETISIDWDGHDGDIFVFTQSDMLAALGGGATTEEAFGAAISLQQDGAFFHSYREQAETTWSQEFRVSGQLNDNLDFVGGVYYFQSAYDITAENTIGLDKVPQSSAHTSKSTALFAQSNYYMTPELRVNLGIRYTKDEKSLDRHIFAGLNMKLESDATGAPIANAAELDLTEDWSEVTPRIGLDYQYTDDLMLYTSLSTGYKGGGWNGRANTPAAAQASYDPETVKTWEGGFKSDLLDNQVRLNATVFYAEFDDLQVDINVPGGPNGQQTLVQNAATATSQGLELELLAKPTYDSTFAFTYGFLDASYDTFIFDEAQADGSNIRRDYSGNDLRRSPAHQFAVSGNQEWNALEGTMVANLSYKWVDEMEMTADNDPYLKVNDLGTFDASLTYYSADEKLKVALFGRNLTDERELVYTFNVAGFWQFGSPNLPRTVGLNVGYRF